MKKIVTIFDENYRVIFFLSKRERLEIEAVGDQEKKKVEEIIEYLKQNKPRFMRDIFSKDGTNSSIVMEEIDESDDLYMDAVAQEFKMKRFRAFAVPAELREALLILSHENISKADREKVIADVINMRGDMLKDFSETFKDVEAEIRKIRENQKDWNKFMEEKIASTKK